jgi:hypothetical protein
MWQLGDIIAIRGEYGVIVEVRNEQLAYTNITRGGFYYCFKDDVMKHWKAVDSHGTVV